ncbi:MAG: DUF1697 domain-containing protein [Candidatus Zhuqueibacterota bacterium]
MERCVAFLRAVNVGGHATVGMDALKQAFYRAGCSDVRTFLQSGNVIFDHPATDRNAALLDIQVALDELLGFKVVVIFRSSIEIENIVRSTPFSAREARDDVKFYVTFLSQIPNAGLDLPLVSAKDAIEIIDIQNAEVYVVSALKKNGMYGFPNDFIEKRFGIPATTRNWSTVTKIAARLGSLN